MRAALIAFVLTLQPLTAISAMLPVDPAGAAPPHKAPLEASRTGVNQDDTREGGEGFADAVVIQFLPYTDSGNTCDNIDNITLPCAYSAAPDVVYRFSPEANSWICPSLCGSSYDTALGVYDAGLNCIACNDDYCGLQSQLLVSLVAGQTYYFVVDGYSTNCGSYRFDIVLGCPMPGACCFEDGSCQVLDIAVCVQEGGTYQGVGTACEPNPCVPVPTQETSWGRIKSSYR